MENIKLALGKKIKQLRKNKKYTQETLSELADIEIPSLSNIENGKNYPNHETLLKIAKALDVRPYELYIFEYFYDTNILIKNMVEAMEKNSELTQKMYQFFLCIK